jgi:hypothetical protein
VDTAEASVSRLAYRIDVPDVDGGQPLGLADGD